MAEQFAGEIGAMFMTCSALNGSGIDAVFNALIERVVRQMAGAQTSASAAPESESAFALSSAVPASMRNCC